MEPSRREFLLSCGAAVASAACETGSANGTTDDVSSWRGRFPALSRNPALAYLDSAATTLRPESVIRAIADFYGGDNANPSRTVHSLARRAYDRYEGARETVARFINARDHAEIVWTRGTTEAINLVAASWGGANLRDGDEVVVTMAEHYSNLLPWRLAAERAGARVRYLEIDEAGRLRVDELEALLSSRTRIVAVTHVSNVLGMVNPIRAICDRAHRAGALVIVDGAQSVPHVPVDVRELDCDFLAFSSHKMLGPMGVGVLWARRELLESMPPYHSGSNMTHDVEHEGPLHFGEAAYKFQAGTPNVSGPVGLAAAIELYEELGRDAIVAHERGLVRHAMERLRQIPGLKLLGAGGPTERVPVFAFTIDNVPVPDLVKGLDAESLAVRGGDLAARPLLERFGVAAAARASCFLYTTTEEIDRLVDALGRIKARSE